MNNYHVFKKTKESPGGKKIRRWYYYYLDENKKQIQRVCTGCRTRKDAEDFIRALEQPWAVAAVTVQDVARDMYVPGSDHVDRRRQLGRSVEAETLTEARFFIKSIIATWGHRPVASMSDTEITEYLFTVQRSGSWKNRYMGVFGEIFREAKWHGCKIARPDFQSFARHSKKADVFTTDELGRLFVPDNFPGEMFYLMFLLCLSAGLRLGEVRAVRPKQLIPDRMALIVDGFCKPDGTRTNYNKTGSAEHPRLRVALLPDFTLLKMAGYIEKNGIAPDDFCFTLNDRPVRTEYSEAVFWKALVKAGIAKSIGQMKEEGIYVKGKVTDKSLLVPGGRKLVPHSLRYTYVTRMRRELPVDTVRKMVGHSSLEMTDYYTNKAALEEVLAGLKGASGAADNLFQ